MIPIFSSEPHNWRDLQNKVAKVFMDMRYATTIEKDITTVRGKVNVDVFAHKKVKSLSETIIVECKHWARPVTKTTIHAFRSVVSDYGANLGLIISKNGFQKGALEAAENSNIQLFTFSEFQEEFRNDWLDEVIDRNSLAVYPLRRYCNIMDSFLDPYINSLDKIKKDRYADLRNYYESTSGLAVRMFYKGINNNITHEYLDEIILSYYNDLPIEKPQSLMSYFDYLYNFSLDGIAAFDNLFQKKIRKWE